DRGVVGTGNAMGPPPSMSFAVGRKVTIERMTEEHGMGRAEEPVQLGERIRFYPYHACTCCNLTNDIVGVRSGKVETVWQVAGGGDAIEAAIKLAMRVTGGTEVISLHGAYHGMSLATMSLAGIAPDRSWFPGGIRWPTFRQVPNADTYRNPLGEGPEAWRASV